MAAVSKAGRRKKEAVARFLVRLEKEPYLLYGMYTQANSGTGERCFCAIGLLWDEAAIALNLPLVWDGDAPSVAFSDVDGFYASRKWLGVGSEWVTEMMTINDAADLMTRKQRVIDYVKQTLCA